MRVIGFQVQNEHGENWGDRPSYEILPEDVAAADLLDARASGVGNWLMIAILPGDIEEPTFY